MADGNAEPCSEVANDDEGRIAFPAFDAADVGPVAARPVSEFLLGPAARSPQLAHAAAESTFEGGGFHARMTALPSRCV